MRSLHRLSIVKNIEYVSLGAILHRIREERLIHQDERYGKKSVTFLQPVREPIPFGFREEALYLNALRKWDHPAGRVSHLSYS